MTEMNTDRMWFSKILYVSNTRMTYADIVLKG